jgi:hypothetical protein
LNLSTDFLHIEPGDILSIDSLILNIPGEIVKVLSVTPESGLLRFSLAKLDANTLAWNVSDTEASPVRNIFMDKLPSVSLNSIVYTFDNTSAFIGYITWDPARFSQDPSSGNSRVVGYKVMKAEVLNGNSTAWVELATTASLRYDFTDLAKSDFYVTVIAVGSDGRLTPSADWPMKYPS